MEWARSPKAEIFKILQSFDVLDFNNTKWPTCVYMLFVFKGKGHMLMDLEHTTAFFLDGSLFHT